MDFLRRLLCDGWHGHHGNECNITEEEIPHMNDFLEKIEPAFLVVICVGLIMTGLVLVLGFFHWLFVLKFISNEQIRTDMYWLVMMGPVVSLCGAVGMLIPRAAIFLYAIALVYFMICIFVLVCIMTTLNGSRQAMCEKLSARGVKISVQVCPLGCCFCCFPKLEPSETTFRRIEWLVFQSPIVRIFLEVVNIIVFMEINSRASLFFQISNLIGIISLFIGSYGSYMIIPAGSSLLSEYRFLLLFRLVDFSQLAWSVQKFLVEFLAFPRFHIFSIQTVLPASAKAQFCISFLLCLEMLVVSLMATWMFRPSQTWFFDKFRHSPLGGAGRSCRIGDANSCRNGSANKFTNLSDSRAIHFYVDGPEQNYSQSSLRLEQVRINGSGQTVSTVDEADGNSQQHRPSRESAERRGGEKTKAKPEANGHAHLAVEGRDSSPFRQPSRGAEDSQSSSSAAASGNETTKVPNREKRRPKWTIQVG